MFQASRSIDQPETHFFIFTFSLYILLKQQQYNRRHYTRNR